MRISHVFAVVGLLVAGTGSASAQQNLRLEFKNGLVSLSAQNVSISQILAEWSRRGRTTIVNGERVPGPAVTLELQDVSEQQALEVLLRGVSGYLVAARDSALTGASAYDRIYILPTSSRPSTAAAQAPPPPQQAFQAIQEDDDVVAPTPGNRGLNPPAARLPRDAGQPGVQPGVAARPPVPLDPNEEPEEPEPRPATGPTTNNPFMGTIPGSSRPGVVTPGPPAGNRPREQ
jgi:hypothetical protein